MRRLLFGISGALLLGASCIGIAWAIGALFGPLYQGEEESTRNFKIFIALFVISIIVGAISGFIYGGKTNKRANQTDPQ